MSENGGEVMVTLTSMPQTATDELLLLLLVLLLFDEFEFWVALDFGPRGGILSNTFDFFDTVRVFALDGDT